MRIERRTLFAFFTAANGGVSTIFFVELLRKYFVYISGTRWKGAHSRYPFDASLSNDVTVLQMDLGVFLYVANLHAT